MMVSCEGASRELGCSEFASWVRRCRDVARSLACEGFHTAAELPRIWGAKLEPRVDPDEPRASRVRWFVNLITSAVCPLLIRCLNFQTACLGCVSGVLIRV